MLLEFFSHLVSLDLAWFIQLVMANLIWLFLFFVASDIFAGQKNFRTSLLIFSVLIFDVMLMIQITPVFGFTFTAGSFLMLYYMTKLALVVFVEETPSIARSAITLISLHGFVVYFWFNWFMV